MKQNVLAVTTFDQKFIYVLAGWEGSAHDSHVLTYALSNQGGFNIPEGIKELENNFLLRMIQVTN